MALRILGKQLRSERGDLGLRGLFFIGLAVVALITHPTLIGNFFNYAYSSLNATDQNLREHRKVNPILGGFERVNQERAKAAHAHPAGGATQTNAPTRSAPAVTVTPRAASVHAPRAACGPRTPAALCGYVDWTRSR